LTKGGRTENAPLYYATLPQGLRADAGSGDMWSSRMYERR